MSSSFEEESNRQSKSQEDTETNSETEMDDQSSYFDDQEVSYEILSNDELLSEDSSDDDIQDEDYFGSSTSEESEESEVAWTDSDDDSNLREELENEAVWLNTEGITKKIKKTQKKISFKYIRSVFTAKCKIKLFKVFPNIKVLVDSFNLVYLIKNFEDFKTFKIGFFKITDVCFFNDKILVTSDTSSFIKQIDLDGKVTDIKKNTGKIKKIQASGDHLYVLSDKLILFNKNFSVINEFNLPFKDFCITDNSVVCLKEDGDIHIFDKELTFKEKVSFQFKFQFRSIYFAHDKILVCMDTGIMFLDSTFKEIKTFTNLKEAVSTLSFNKDFIVHGSQHPNSLRILKSDLTYFEKFPFSKIKINPISTMDIEGDTVYFSDSKFVSSLKLKYV